MCACGAVMVVVVSRDRREREKMVKNLYLRFIGVTGGLGVFFLCVGGLAMVKPIKKQKKRVPGDV